ncbi:MAG: hypothetical protein WBW73_00760, partial [Rhodoplanes sp.]
QWTTRRETTFYASSVMLPAKTFASAIRNHWAIENQNHWVRDVTLAEDAGPIRTLRVISLRPASTRTCDALAKRPLASPHRAANWWRGRSGFTRASCSGGGRSCVVHRRAFRRARRYFLR